MPYCHHRQLEQRSKRFSTCVVFEKADHSSSVRSALEMLVDEQSSLEYRGIVLYVQESARELVHKELRKQGGSIEICFGVPNERIGSINFCESNDSNELGDKSSSEPNIFFETFKSMKDLCVAIPNGVEHSSGLSIWTEEIGVALEFANRVTGYRDFWINCQNFYLNNDDAFGDILFSSESGYRQAAPLTIPQEMVSQAHVPSTSSEQACRTIKSALNAHPLWKERSPTDRAQLVYQFEESLCQLMGELQKNSTTNTAVSTYDQELQDDAEVSFSWAGHCISHSSVYTVRPNITVSTSRESVGVVGIVCPPSITMGCIVRLLTSAIAVGNAVVMILPGESLNFRLNVDKAVQKAVLPTGVINIICGSDKELANTLAGHHDIAAFWCSTCRKTIELVELCGRSNKRKLWWFDVSLQDGGDWSEEKLNFYRSYEKFVWVCNKSVFAN